MTKQNINLREWEDAYTDPLGYSKLEPVPNQAKYDRRDDHHGPSDMDHELRFEEDE